MYNKHLTSYVQYDEEYAELQKLIVDSKGVQVKAQAEMEASKLASLRRIYATELEYAQKAANNQISLDEKITQKAIQLGIKAELREKFKSITACADLEQQVRKTRDKEVKKQLQLELKQKKAALNELSKEEIKQLKTFQKIKALEEKKELKSNVDLYESFLRDGFSRQEAKLALEAEGISDVEKVIKASKNKKFKEKFNEILSSLEATLVKNMNDIADSKGAIDTRLQGSKQSKKLGSY